MVHNDKNESSLVIKGLLAAFHMPPHQKPAQYQLINIKKVLKVTVLASLSSLALQCVATQGHAVQTVKSCCQTQWQYSLIALTLSLSQMVSLEVLLRQRQGWP